MDQTETALVEALDLFAEKMGELSEVVNLLDVMLTGAAPRRGPSPLSADQPIAKVDQRTA